MEESAGGEVDLEVDLIDPGLRDVNGLPAALVVAVPLHVHDPVEVPISEVNVHKDTVSQTVHLNIKILHTCPYN